MSDRDPKRIPVMLAALEAAWTANPDLRLGQLVVNAHYGTGHASDADPFYTEDGPMLDALRNYPTSN